MFGNDEFIEIDHPIATRPHLADFRFVQHFFDALGSPCSRAHDLETERLMQWSPAWVEVACDHVWQVIDRARHMRHNSVECIGIGYGREGRGGLDAGAM